MSEICTLAVIGDGSVGKSSIISTFRNDGFAMVYRQTVGCDFYEKQIPIRDKHTSLRVWDIGGQSMNSKNLPTYLSSSQVIFIVYDVTNAESFANLEDWLRLATLHSPTSKIHIVGNKVDLIENRQVTKQEHDKFVRSNDAVQSGLFMSARSGDNVVKAFYKAAAEHYGITLTTQELAYYDVVVKAHISKGYGQDDADGRTAWADDIEREDRLAEQRKNKPKGCICS